MTPSQKLAIVIPLFNDWDSLRRLLGEIDRVAGRLDMMITIIVVDDGTTDVLPIEDLTADRFRRLSSIEILHLVCNLGHQRAIAVGLAEVNRRSEFSAVVVMDSDGEDQPDDIQGLVQAWHSNRECLVVAQRIQRSEGFLFGLFYSVYKFVFHILTGKIIDFGNFCLIPAKLLHPLVFSANIWNNLPATVVRSCLPVLRLATTRGQRYAGKSKMNTTSLVLHGLSAVSVFGEIVFVRALFASSLLALLSLFSLIGVVTVKYTTNLAIPGWATTAAGLLLIILAQALMFSAQAVFLVLTNRSGSVVIPAIDGERYVKDRRIVFKA